MNTLFPYTTLFRSLHRLAVAQGVTVAETWCRGDAAEPPHLPLMHLTYFGDFVSLYLALLNAVDPENIDYINILKAELAKAGG